jgi:lysophospholipase L1-like esterase
VRLAPAIRVLLLLSCGLAASTCGGSPTAPPAGPFTACPANFTVESADGGPVAVTYELPGMSGGVAPLAVTCTPPPGTPLAVGAHPIACTVTDARGTTASCTFEVRVLAPPRLQATRFLAFGDSITEGKDSPPAPTNLLVEMPGSYPWHLERMLRSRYSLQPIDVLNNGMGGEAAHETGYLRLPESLDEYRPEALLLMEGTNDLLGLTVGLERGMVALDQMVREAKGRGIRVFLATIPPQRSGGLRNRDLVAGLIPQFNERIRALAAREGVVLVDVYDAMKDRLHLIGIDDLHPTLEGYEVMAETFKEAIQGSLEEPRVLISRLH